MYTPETVQAVARAMQTDDAPHYAADAAHMLEDYAATLRQAPAQGGVTEAMVERALIRYAMLKDQAVWPDAYSDDELEMERRDMRAALEAALSAEPAAQGEAVAVIGADFTIHWIGTGPIAPIIEKHGLKVGDKLYTAPPAQPAERVPGAYVMDSGFKYESVGKHIPTVLVGFAPDDFDARDRFAAMLAATPAAPADGDGKEGVRTLAKYQPCGCVICTCEDEVQCHGCGAHHCGSHLVAEFDNPVYTTGAAR